MIQFPGTDRFTDYFDFFEWSAPIYESIDEVREGFKKLNVFNKEIKDVRVIGCVYYSGVDAIKDRIIDYLRYAPEKTVISSDKYESLDSYRIDNSVLVSEPLIIDFTDGTSFEFMPMKVENCRMSENSIPHKIEDGMNYSNFYLSKVLFQDCIGCRLTGMQVLHDKNYVSSAGSSYRHWCDSGNIPAKYRYAIELGNSEGHSKYLVITPIDVPFEDAGNFTISLHSDINDDPEQITVSDVVKSRKPVSQLCLTYGHTVGGTCTIGIDKSEEQDNLARYLADCQTHLSVEEEDFRLWLERYFREYFNPRIQTWKSDCCSGFYDEYGFNKFTYHAIRAVIADLHNAAASLLAGDELPVPNMFEDWDSRIYPPTSLDLFNAAIIGNGECQCRLMMADYYERVCRYLEGLMATIEDGHICVAGP